MKAPHAQTVRLLKTARGQINGILNMIEEDQYCVDISNQLLASQAVLRKANQLVIKSHLESCVKTAVKSGNEKDAQAKLDEIYMLIEKLSK